MGAKREKTKRNYRLLSLLSLALFQPLFISTFAEQIAWAESVILQLPLPEVSGDHFGYSASRGRLHAGVDLRARTPTPVTYQGNFQTCDTGGSGLVIGKVANACGVTQRFLHLTSCGGGKFITGNSGINPKTGKNYDFHLHWEVLINGTPVDPELAVGKDLCDEQVRKQLLDDAKTKGSGSGGGGAATGINQPAPAANTSGGSIDYVAPGATNPTTGVVNTGGAYYYTVTPSGQVIIEIAPNPGDENESPVLPPPPAVVVPPGGSSNNDVTGCATDTWTAMVNQSVMQTRREMMYNERFVAKPDSVLAYSCFEKTLTDYTGKNVGVFSTTKAWVNKQIDIAGKTLTVNKELGSDTMDGAIRNAAIVPTESYLNGMFNHNFLGGMMTDSGASDDESSAQVNAACGKMMEVWNAAKCTNFSDTTPFKKFDELIQPDSDPRIYPPQMQCKNTGITQDMIDIAKNKSAKFDKINPYLDMLSPPDNTCFTPLTTGVTVVRRKGSEIISQEVNYQDGVCISPGCSYQNTGTSGKGTCEVKGP